MQTINTDILEGKQSLSDCYLILITALFAYLLHVLTEPFKQGADSVSSSKGATNLPL